MGTDADQTAESEPRDDQRDRREAALARQHARRDRSRPTGTTRRTRSRSRWRTRSVGKVRNLTAACLRNAHDVNAMLAIVAAAVTVTSRSPCDSAGHTCGAARNLAAKTEHATVEASHRALGFTTADRYRRRPARRARGHTSGNGWRNYIGVRLWRTRSRTWSKHAGTRRSVRAVLPSRRRQVRSMQAPCRIVACLRSRPRTVSCTLRTLPGAYRDARASTGRSLPRLKQSPCLVP